MTGGTVLSRILGLARSRVFYTLFLVCALLWGGMRLLPLLFQERYILSGLLSVFCTQGMKPFTYRSDGGIAWRQLFRCGGMPSSHAAVSAALATSLGLDYGWTSPIFQTAAVLGGIVIYDSVTLRRVVGEHSRLIKEMVCDKSRRVPLLGEMIGHTPLEASVGAFCGVLCALLVVRV